MVNHPNRGTKRVRLTEKSGPLHIEAPGCIINISPGLADAEGRSIVHISVSADGDRYSGDPEWWIDGEPGRDGRACRVIRTVEPG